MKTIKVGKSGYTGPPDSINVGDYVLVDGGVDRESFMVLAVPDANGEFDCACCALDFGLPCKRIGCTSRNFVLKNIDNINESI